MPKFTESNDLDIFFLVTCLKVTGTCFIAADPSFQNGTFKKAVSKPQSLSVWNFWNTQWYLITAQQNWKEAVLCCFDILKLMSYVNYSLCLYIVMIGSLVIV